MLIFFVSPYFSRVTKNIPQRICAEKIVLGGNRIPWSNEVKYLGVTLDKTLTFNSHVTKSIEKANLAFRILYSFLNRRSKLCVPNKLVGVAEYGSEIFLLPIFCRFSDYYSGGCW
jgi:hypothetical protein